MRERRLAYALELREMTPHRLVVRLKEKEGIPWASTRQVYGFLNQGKGRIPVEFLEACAEILEVRPTWLAFGDGPCEAGVPADPVRELYLVDGVLEGFTPPGDPEVRREIRRDFERGFGDPEGFSRVSLTVVHMFMNYLARYFRRCREEPRGTPDQASWRGEEAAKEWEKAVKLARNNKSRWKLGTKRRLDDSPEVTGALLWALGSYQIQRPPKKRRRS